MRLQPLLHQEACHTVARFSRAVLSVRPLIDVLEPPVRVSLLNDRNRPAQQFAERDDSFAAYCQLLNQVAIRLGAPQLALCQSVPYSDLSIFEQVISSRLSMDCEPACQLPATALAEIDQIVEEILREDFDRKYKCSEIISFDGARLRAYSTGARSEKAIILVSACGMPAKLCDRWMDFFGKDNFVITWESRGLFAEGGNFDSLAYDVAAQAEDLLAVMNHFGVKAGHLMGLCGGAVIALTAAAASPARVSSLSLWHGDFDLGPDCPKTGHQDNLKALLLAAAESRASAATIREVFCQSMLITTARPQQAHLILYPYATDELMFRYARLNGSIMETDVSHLLGKVTQPTLVVTSEDDSTAHPTGSKLVAAGLPNSTLRVEPHGDHISLFDAEPGITRLAARFISQEEL